MGFFDLKFEYMPRDVGIFASSKKWAVPSSASVGRYVAHHTSARIPYQACGGTATMSTYKTKMCVYHVAGVCTRGTRCAFAHSEDELRPGRPQQREAREEDPQQAQGFGDAGASRDGDWSERTAQKVSEGVYALASMFLELDDLEGRLTPLVANPNLAEGARLRIERLDEARRGIQVAMDVCSDIPDFLTSVRALEKSGDQNRTSIILARNCDRRVTCTTEAGAEVILGRNRDQIPIRLVHQGPPGPL